MGFSLEEILTCFLVLFAVIDMPGNIPIIVSLRSKIGHIQSEKATIVAGVLLISFLYLGVSILNLIGIDKPSFAIAGSFVLFIIALELILGIDIQRVDESSSSTASIVPIAFPLIVGAGSLTTVLSLKSQYANINIIIGIILNLIVIYIVLKNAGRIGDLLGNGALNVLKKVFGIILLAIAVKLFSTNVGELFKSAVHF